MKSIFLVIFLTLTVGAGLSAQRPRLNFCTSDSKDEKLKCPCLTQHPDLCESEDPLPFCCKATEKGTKANGGCHGLSLRDAIEVLADYELIHPHVPLREEWWGWTDPDERRMFVIANADLSVRRRTVLHELLHVSRRFRNQVAADKQQEEDEVAIASAIMYEELFGGAK